MNTRTLLALASLAALGCACVATAQVTPQVIFRDTFDVSAPSDDLDFEAATRQTGLVAPRTYSVTGTPQLGQADALNQLRMPSGSYVCVNHNFVEGGTYSIEFDLDPGIDDLGSPLAGDWCAVVLGASMQNPFVFSSDGLGILFRNNGNIEVWETQAQGVVYSGTGDVAIPTDQPFHVKLDVVAADFRGSPATIRMSINGQQARIDPTTLEHVKATGLHGNYVTFEAYADAPNAWVNAFDNLTITATPCVRTDLDFANAVAGQQTDPIAVSIPAQLNASQPVAITVRSLDPSLATPVGADPSGALKLNFTAGGPTVQTFKILGLKAGATSVVVDAPAGACSLGRVDVIVAAGVGVPEMVFSDTFDVTAPTFDINAENTGGRQAGSAAVLDYREPADNAPGGLYDEYSAINTDTSSGKLYLTATGLTWVAPDYNFVDGPEFAIEFTLDPSVLDPDRLSGDWAAVVFGASAPGSWVNASDGIGVLFRSNGGYQIFDGATAVYTSTVEETLPAGELRVRIAASTVDFMGTRPATVALYVNDTQVKMAPQDLAYTKPAGFRGNYVTLEGYAASGLYWIYAFDDFKVTAQACVHAQPSRIDFAPGSTSANLTVKVPAAFNTGKSGTVRLVSRNPSVATLAGATAGELTLTFVAGAAAQQTVEVVAVNSGATVIDLYNDQGICTGDPIQVTVRAGLVLNPSFESNYNPTSPSYGVVNAWRPGAGGGGVNQANGPFHDNGAIPDRNRVMFIQGSGMASQTITGLTPGKTYWVQLRYNARNCCGGPTVGMTVRFDGTDLGVVDAITPVLASNPYRFRSFPFTPAAESGLLEIVSSVSGDGTLLVDAVTIVQRDDGNVVVQNPSFEASGTLPGVGVIARLSGWALEGAAGVDIAGGLFADNGVVPDQDLVAFIQGPGALTQTLVGLVSGQIYKVTFAYNAGSSGTPHLKATADATVLLDTDVTAVGTGKAFARATASFRATASSAILRIEQTAPGTPVLLLDDVRIEGQSINIPCLEVNRASLQLAVGQIATALAVTVPPEFVAAGSASVTVTSDDPAVADCEGAVGGALTLTFSPFADLTQVVPVRGLKRGATTLRFANSLDVCFNRVSTSVLVLSSFVRNPSFEDNSNTGWPGYGPLDSWTSEGGGNTGTNNKNDTPGNRPFLDNGSAPDRNQVALLQTSKTIRQEIVGLTTGKNYWVQFFYNARNMAAGAQLDMSVVFDYGELAYISAVAPVGGVNPFHFGQAAFTPMATSGVLDINSIAVSGDVTLLLDGVCIVQRDADQIVVKNPSFEASGIVPEPGFIQSAAIAGWDSGGGQRGVNQYGVGPFADNGVNPDQDSVVFLEGAGTYISQTLEGLATGENYTVTFAANAHSTSAPRLKVTFDDQVLVDDAIAPVGGANPYTVKSGVFRANGAIGVLRFEQTALGDHTVLLDNVTVAPGGTLPERITLSVRMADTTGVRLAWPASAMGFSLWSTDALGGSWSVVTLPVVIENTEQAVYVPASSLANFYRLKK